MFIIASHITYFFVLKVVWRKLSHEDHNKNSANGTDEDDEIFEDLL